MATTVVQNTGRQLDGISLDKVFEDKVSASTADRPQLTACLDYLREGDSLHVHSIGRLAQNLADLEKIVIELTSKGVEIIFTRNIFNSPVMTIQ